MIEHRRLFLEFKRAQATACAAANACPPLSPCSQRGGKEALLGGYLLLATARLEFQLEFEFNPRRLDQVEERLALIRNLQRKYGATIEDVLAFARRARRELEDIEHSEERIAELEAEEERLLREIGRLGAELTAQRRAAGERLAAGIEVQLEELSMARARFGVDIAWRDDVQGAYVEGRRVALT